MSSLNLGSHTTQQVSKITGKGTQLPVPYRMMQYILFTSAAMVKQPQEAEINTSNNIILII